MVDLISAGAISQTGGTLTAAHADRQRRDIGEPDPADQHGRHARRVQHDGRLRTDEQSGADGRGPVSDTGAASTLALTTKTGDITLAGTVSATNMVDLISAGTISQTGGSITAAHADRQRDDSASLTQPTNLVGTLGAFSTTAGFALTNDEALRVDGPVTDTGAASTLALTTKTGGITLAGTVSAANVRGPDLGRHDQPDGRDADCRDADRQRGPRRA